jgi:hypothetical protein
MNKKQQSSFVIHLRRIAAYVAVTFWLAFAYAGGKLVSMPETGRHSHFAGWTILSIAALTMILTMNYWVKYLHFIFGGLILGCLLATGTGHLLNDAPFPRWIAALLMALFVGCAVISRTFVKRKLRIADRLALTAFLAAFVGGLIKDTPISGLIGVGIGFCCLLVALLHDRISSHSHSARSLFV